MSHVKSPDTPTATPVRRCLRAMLAVTSIAAVIVSGLGTATTAAMAAPSRGDVTVRLNGRTILVHPHGRFGLYPTKSQAHPYSIQATPLRYGGGIDGIGVTTGAPKVYIIYWGTQWGTASLDGNGYTKFTNDTAGLAPDQQAFFAGLGNAGEQWDGVTTQYCEGVALHATTCPTNVPHVGYPVGGALAGIWYDNAAAAPAAASAAQLAAEAVAGAAHFGNTNAASNRNAQYVVTSAKGTNPDHYKTGGFCAWHDYTTSAYGDIAYTNMPYLLDVGASCGQNFVNSGSAGTLDGVTIVNGHEYQETITDQNPAGGWTDSTGYENADKCAWISSGQGAAQNIALTTGSFPVQSSWANDFNGGAGGCLIYHAIFGADYTIGASPPSVSIARGSTGTTTINTSVSGGFYNALTLSASGLPSGTTAGFSPNPIPVPGGGSSTLTFTVGSGTTPGTYTVTVGGAGGGVNHSTSVSLTVTGKQDQTITFGALADRTYGDADFGVSATASSGLPVTFTASGQCTVSGSTVHITGAGSCTVTAHQSGDSNWNPAPDVAQSFTIAKANQTISFFVADHSYGDPDFTISASASSGLAVSFSLVSGNCTLNGATVHITGAGSCSIEATQGGDGNYNPAPDVTDTFDIFKADQTISFGSLSDRTYGDADFDVSASASSGLTVSFSAAGPCTVSGATVHLTGAGSCTITAHQGGDSNYNPASDVPQSFTVGKASQTITFDPLADHVYGDADFGVSATSSSGLAVSFVASGSCTVAGSTVHLTGAGSCAITAQQAGDSNYDAAPDVPRSFTVAPAPTTTALMVKPRKTHNGATVTMTATVSAPGSLVATGVVDFYTRNVLLGSAAVNGSGVAVLSYTVSLSPGKYKVRAVYVNSDGNFTGSTSMKKKLVVK